MRSLQLRRIRRGNGLQLRLQISQVSGQVETNAGTLGYLLQQPPSRKPPQPRLAAGARPQHANFLRKHKQGEKGPMLELAAMRNDRSLWEKERGSFVLLLCVFVDVLWFLFLNKRPVLIKFCPSEKFILIYS